MAKKIHLQRKKPSVETFLKVQSKYKTNYLENVSAEDLLKLKTKKVTNIDVKIDLGDPQSEIDAYTFIMQKMQEEIQEIVDYFEGIIEKVVLHRIYELVENQEFYGLFSDYPPLSTSTLEKASEMGYPKGEMHFFQIVGFLVQNGIEVRWNHDSSRIELYPAEGFHPYAYNKTEDGNVPVSYAKLWNWLEYGTKKAPPRPFFSVIEPLVNDYAKDVLKTLLKKGGYNSDTVNISWD